MNRILLDRIPEMNYSQFKNSYSQKFLDDYDAKQIGIKIAGKIELTWDDTELLIQDIINLRADEWFEDACDIPEFMELFTPDFDSPFTIPVEGDYLIIYGNDPREEDYLLCNGEDVDTLLDQYSNNYNFAEAMYLYDFEF